jgi:hypothetical protein
MTGEGTVVLFVVGLVLVALGLAVLAGAWRDGR